jgi:hypothetical protein
MMNGRDAARRVKKSLFSPEEPDGSNEREDKDHFLEYALIDAIHDSRTDQRARNQCQKQDGVYQE